MGRPVIAWALTAVLLAGCSVSTDGTRPGGKVLSTPAPAEGARFDLTHRPSRDEVGLTSGARTIAVGRSTAKPFTATVVTEAGEVAVRARDVLIDSGPADGAVNQVIVQLVIVDRREREAELRRRAPGLGLDPSEIDAFFGRAAQSSAEGSTDGIESNLRGGTTGGGPIEVVLHHNPTDDTIFENIEVTWLS